MTTGGVPLHTVVIAVTVFGLVFLGELPDKTAIACLVLGARYRALPVLVGAWAAFACQVALAVVAGGLVARLPRRPVELVTAALFLIGGVLLYRAKGEEIRDPEKREGARSRPFGAVAGSAFGIVFMAEFGDVTQLLTASLAARYDEPLAVGVGAVLALWAVAAIAVVAGRTLLAFLPLRRVQQTAATGLVLLAVLALVAGIRA